MALKLRKLNEMLMTEVVGLVEDLAIANQVEFIYDGRVVAGHSDVLVVDPTVDKPVELVGGVIRVHVVPKADLAGM